MTRQAFTPREYQQPVIDHILDVSRDAVWAGMGMGKGERWADDMRSASAMFLEAGVGFEYVEARQ